MQKEGVLKWISRGRPRVLAKVLIKPMTAGEIWQAARQLNPKIQLRDVRPLLRPFIEKGLIYCLVHEKVKGSLFFWTEYGKEIVSLAGIYVPAAPDIDWNAYSFVVRAKMRRLIVSELSRPGQKQPVWTAEEIRRVLSKQQTFGLRSITRALKGLEACGVIECVGYTETGKRKLYRLVEKGRKIACQLSESRAVMNE